MVVVGVPRRRRHHLVMGMADRDEEEEEGGGGGSRGCRRHPSIGRNVNPVQSVALECTGWSKTKGLHHTKSQGMPPNPCRGSEDVRLDDEEMKIIIELRTATKQSAVSHDYTTCTISHVKMECVHTPEFRPVLALPRPPPRASIEDTSQRRTTPSRPADSRSPLPNRSMRFTPKR